MASTTSWDGKISRTNWRCFNQPRVRTWEFTDYSSYSKFAVATIVDFKKHQCRCGNIVRSIMEEEAISSYLWCSNVKKGLKGIFATDGMYMSGTDITLKKGKSEEISEGMMLSERN